MTKPRPLTLAAVWLMLPIVGAVIAATLEPIPPHDYWWHLAMGRLIGGGALPDTNLFLYTLPADLPFVNQAWLGQWLMWVAYDALGHPGTILLRNVLLVAAFALVIATASRRAGDARAAGALGLLAAVLAYPVLNVRTRMFAFLPFAIVLWVSFGVLEGRLRRRWLALLPVVTVFWANTHGSFVLSAATVFSLGFGSVAHRAVTERSIDLSALRDWGATLVAVILAGAATPLGLGTYGYVQHLTSASSVTQTVTEWLPPDVADLQGQIFLGAVVAATLLLALRRRHVAIGDALLFAGTLVLAAGAVRSMFWWAAILPIVLAPHVASFLPDASVGGAPSRSESWVIRGTIALLCLATIFVQPGVGRELLGEMARPGSARQSEPGAWVLSHENAESAVSRIRDDRRARVFHDQVLGGLLEFRLTDETPAQVAYVDQRMEFVPEETWAKYFALSRAIPRWDEELRRLGVDTLLLSADAQWPLVQAALVSAEWELVALEQSHLLLYRVGSLDRSQDPSKQGEAEQEEGDIHHGDDP